MSHIQESAIIKDVQIATLKPFADERGRFMETFRKEWFPQRSWDIIQTNRSDSKAGVLRGLHYHFRQVDYWYVIAGKIRAGLYDLRSNSPTYGQSRSSRWARSAATRRTTSTVTIRRRGCSWISSMSSCTSSAKMPAITTTSKTSGVMQRRSSLLRRRPYHSQTPAALLLSGSLRRIRSQMTAKAMETTAGINI